jgi:hypothetical protein
MRNLDSCHCWRCTLCPCKLKNKFLAFWNRTILLCTLFIYIYFFITIFILQAPQESSSLKLCYCCLSQKRYNKNINYERNNVADSLKCFCHVCQDKQIEEYSQISAPQSCPVIHFKLCQVSIQFHCAVHRQSLRGLSRQRPEFSPSTNRSVIWYVESFTRKKSVLPYQVLCYQFSAHIYSDFLQRLVQFFLLALQSRREKPHRAPFIIKCNVIKACLEKAAFSRKIPIISYINLVFLYTTSNF